MGLVFTCSAHFLSAPFFFLSLAGHCLIGCDQCGTTFAMVFTQHSHFFLLFLPLFPCGRGLHICVCGKHCFCVYFVFLGFPTRSLRQLYAVGVFKEIEAHDVLACVFFSLLFCFVDVFLYHFLLKTLHFYPVPMPVFLPRLLPMMMNLLGRAERMMSTSLLLTAMVLLFVFPLIFSFLSVSGFFFFHLRLLSVTRYHFILFLRGLAGNSFAPKKSAAFLLYLFFLSLAFSSESIHIHSPTCTCSLCQMLVQLQPQLDLPAVHFFISLFYLSFAGLLLC